MDRTTADRKREMNYAAIVTPDEMQDRHAWLEQALGALRRTPTCEPRAEVKAVKQGWGTLQVGRSVSKGPLCLQGQTYAKGFGTHADSVIEILLPAPGVRLTGLAGIDDNAGTRANAKDLVFSVEACGREVWKSGAQTPGAAPARVDADLGGCREIRLRATGHINFGHADWVDLQVTLADGSRARLGQPTETGECHSFTYDGRPSTEILRTWILTEETPPVASGWRLRRLTRTDPATGLQAIVEMKEYADFPVVEWLVRFRNTGARDTPILEAVRSLDVAMPADGLLHYHTGEYGAADGYEPHRAPLTPGVDLAFAPDGGRPTNRAWPYYNLEYAAEKRGVITVVGWSGQWASRFQASDVGVRITAGQELTHFRLQPGEEVRTPLSVLMFWRGDRVRAQNLWRRWMMACNLPRTGGNLPAPMLPAYTGRWFAEMALATTETQNAFVDRYVEEGIELDYWWMDAGWYPCDGQWWNTGTWEPDAKRFPKGLREVSDYARTKEMKTLVWFEPERVAEGTWLARVHPEWLLGCLLNLGHPDALHWLIEHVCRTIREQGIDFYRQDFNMEPLTYWRANDAPDRQGITEIRHIEGYLTFWTELRRRFPDMLIDSCASGGRRNDLETMRLSVPLHKTDYNYADLPVKQAFHHSLALWLPYFGAYDMSLDGDRVDTYAFRSSLAPMTMLTEDLRRRDVDWRPLRKLTEEWRQVTDTEYFYGDYYPLTAYSRTEDQTIAWQFNRPDLGQGVVQAFRRKESPFEAARFRIHGLEPAAIYRITDIDEPGREIELSGQTLAESGLPVAMPQAPMAKVILYTRKT